MLNTYNLTLEDTVPYMNSNDYKMRFIGEYWQTKIRYDKLHDMLVKYESGKLGFTPSCSLELLKEQAKYMGMYLNKLEIRASIEEINLDTPLTTKNKVDGSAFVTGLSVDGEDNHQYTIEELDSMTTSAHTDGYVEASDTNWEEDEEDFTFEDMCKYFRVGQRVIHENLFGIGKITNIWYYTNSNSDEELCFNMDIEWDNGATMTLDSRYEEQKKIISSLIAC